MLRIEVVDETCSEDTVHIFKVPLDTPWFKIESAVQMVYPTATEVHMYLEAVEE